MTYARSAPRRGFLYSGVSMATAPPTIPTDYALAARITADVIPKGNYWVEVLRSKGLHAEANVMFDLVTEVMLLREFSGALPSANPARRGPMGDVGRG